MTEYGDSIRLSVTVGHRIQVRQYEPLDVSVTLSQVHMACDEEDLERAHVRAHELIAKSMTQVFEKSAKAKEDAEASDKAMAGVFE